MDSELERKLKTRIGESSFKIKRIFLEMQNYSYFHSVLNDPRDDVNNRFVGRKLIIDRLKSFVHETSKSTGTYLVSGFRGMGKTSVVNQALSSLNPKTKFYRFAVYWFLLLPLVFFFEKLLDVYDDIVTDYLWGSLGFLIITSISLLYYIGYRDPRNRKKIKRKVWTNIKYGIRAIFNSRFQKHKFTFHRILRHAFIYSWLTIFLFKFFSLEKEILKNGEGELHHLQHEFFWFVTCSLIIFYYTLELYVKWRTLIKRKKKEDIILFWEVRIITIAILLIFLILYHSNTYFEDKYWVLIIILAISTLIFATFKSRLGWEKNMRTGEKYANILGRIITFFDLQHYVIIKVNLGKDSLTEKDVLKYITNELYREYKKWYYGFKSFKRFSNVFLLFTILYLIVTTFCKAFLGDEFIDFSNNSAKFAYFFPSQSLHANKDISIEQINSLFIPSNRNVNISQIEKYIENIDTLVNYDDGVAIRFKYGVGYRNLESDGLYSIQDKPNQLISENGLNTGSSEQLVNQNTSSVIINEKTGALHIYSNLEERSQPSIWNKILVSTGAVCNEIDYLIFKLWHRTRLVIIGKSESGFVYTIANIIYPKVPFFSVYFMMILFLLFIRMGSSSFTMFRTHFYLLKKLNRLRSQIDASIIIENGGNANILKTSIFNYLKRTSYKPLESKDITQNLIHILDEVASINHLLTRVRFIFVFDELDKINTHYNTSISSIEDEFDLDTNEVRYQARRKERIGRILSSMKHFLNSAQAKFIFIAGREMYDAALAGISDRESSLDSIFNDNKIYVNSFYTEGEDNNLTDITSITEQYLCQFLIPSDYFFEEDLPPCLRMYKAYLKSINIREDERIKIIATLKDFIVYLTYRSNGAPRKLSNLIEQYVIPVSSKEISLEARKFSLTVGSNNDNPFLRISFYDQYKFSLISYLTSPIFLGLGNYMHEYSDKLLVSISYMLDHMFKHHKFGISYRSLSLTPEIVDINKEPQFREFLDKLISFLSKSHLRTIVSGIYDFKFHGKTMAEITFLSKINEYEAAAFNFTLDESIELKRHFNRRLESLKESKANIIVNNSEYKEDHINNVSLLHMMIGDLHFYDEEYQEAIVHYLDAVQIMRQKDIMTLPLYDFVLYVRNKLKLGLAFEKNKMFDNALMTFSELADLIVRKRNVPIRKYGLARFIIKRNDFENDFRKIVVYRENGQQVVKRFMFGKLFTALHRRQIQIEFEQNPKMNELIVIGRLKESIVKDFADVPDSARDFQWKKLYPIEDMECFYSVKPGDLMKNLENLDINYKPLKLYFQQSTGESIRVLYQPLIAKLHLIGKSSPDKLKDIDVKRAIQEFNFLKLPLNTQEKRVIIAEFYNKIGDLLYFKNGTFNRCLKKKIFEVIDFKNTTASFMEQKAKGKILLISPIDATLFYIKSLAVLLIPTHYNTVCRPCDETNETHPDGETKYIEELKRKSDNKLDLLSYYEINGLESNEGEHENEHDFKSFFQTVVIGNNLTPILTKIFLMYEGRSFRQRYSSEYLDSTANGIIDLADALLSFSNVDDSLDSLEIPISKVFDTKKFLNMDFVYGSLGVPTYKLLNMYHCASVIFEEIGEYHLARSQKLKILYIIKNCTTETLERLSDNRKNNLLYFLKKEGENNNKIEDMIDDCLKLTYSSYDQSYYVENAKLINLLSEEKNENIREIDLTNALQSGVVSTEVGEVVTLYWHLVKKISDTQNLDLIQNFLHTKFRTKTDKKPNDNENIGKICRTALIQYVEKNVTPLAQLKGKYNRVLSLTLLLSINQMKIDENMPSTDEHMFIIMNSIGACNEIIKSHNLFGINYVTTNHIDLAKAHYTMAKWCLEYNERRTDETDKILKKYVLNSETLDYFQAKYHYELAIDYNKKVENFHARGNELQSFLKTASYLDDFHNDNLIHFSIAYERNSLLNEINENSTRELGNKIEEQANAGRNDRNISFIFQEYYKV